MKSDNIAAALPYSSSPYLPRLLLTTLVKAVQR